jgi:hypothetical protein
MDSDSGRFSVDIGAAGHQPDLRVATDPTRTMTKNPDGRCQTGMTTLVGYFQSANDSISTWPRVVRETKTPRSDVTERGYPGDTKRTLRSILFKLYHDVQKVSRDLITFQQ